MADKAVFCVAKLHDYEPHPLADIFPLMPDNDYRALVDDIRAHGLHESIWLYEGKILDGRHRVRACREAGVGIKSRQYTGDDPLGFVIAANLRRRHLNESQRAMAAAKIANLSNGQHPSTSSANLPSFVSTSQAAGLFRISERSVISAKAVQRDASPDLIKAVESAQIPVSAAARIVKTYPTHEAQTEALNGHTFKALAKLIRREERGITTEPLSDFLDDLRAMAANLAANYGMADDAAQDYAHALAIIVSTRYGGQQPYVHRSAYIEDRHAQVYAAWCRIRATESSNETAALRVSNELQDYTPRHVRRIVVACERAAHPRLANTHG